MPPKLTKVQIPRGKPAKSGKSAKADIKKANTVAELKAAILALVE